MTRHLSHAVRVSLLGGLIAGSLLGLLCSGTAGAQTTGATAGVATADYRLGPGDTVRISVYENPDLTLEARIGESGLISYPLLGNLKVGGMSVSEAERLIADGLRIRKFVRAPQVSLFVSLVRGNQASVLGQVNRPGRFPIEGTTLRLSDLLSLAGGISMGGSDTVVLVGNRDGRRIRREIDVDAIFRSTDGDDDVLILNGDVVYVQRAPSAYIYGEVQRPGPMRLEHGLTVLQALATGGGLTVRGTERGVRVHRKGPDGKLFVVHPAMDDELRDGDVVFVRESLF